MKTDFEIYKAFYEAFFELAKEIEAKLVSDNLSTKDKLWIIDSMLKIVKITDAGNPNDKRFIIIMAVLKAIATKSLALKAVNSF